MDKTHVLIVSVDYPPNPSIGSRRISAISSELFSKGFIPHIVTTNNPSLKFKKQLEIPEEFVHYVKWNDIQVLIKMLEPSVFTKYFAKLIGYFCPTSSNTIPERRLNYWINPAIEECLKIIKNHNIKLIYSTYNPPASVRVAAAVKEKTGIPWINEYRDLWTGNPYLNISKKMQELNWNVERDLISNADSLVTVSDPLRLELIKMHNKPTYTIYNGIDEVPTRKKSENTSLINIVYTGILYGNKRDPSPLFKALKILQKKNRGLYNKISLNFYGANVQETLIRYVVNLGLEDVVHLHKPTSHENIIEIQSKADIFLLLGWDNKADEGVVTGKVFEYLSFKKPILALGYKGGAMDILLCETNTGCIINDPLEIYDYLISMVDIVKTDNKLARFKNQIAIAPFYRSNQINSLISIFKQTINQHQSSK